MTNEILEEKMKTIMTHKAKKLINNERIEAKTKAKVNEFKKRIADSNPKIALILGSGFNNILKLEDEISISFNDLGLKSTEISGHTRKFIFGKYKNIPLIIASRVHYYETGDVKNILKLFEILKSFKIQTIIATTAVGAVNQSFKTGDLMLITGHINLTGTNPLIAKTPVTFLDMSNAYNKELCEEIKKIAQKLNIPLKEGTHIQVSGPTYETPSEVVAFRSLGADTVSMSTALDCISANFFDMKFVAFAGITNMAVTNESQALQHEEVVKVSNMISQNLGLIIKDLLINLNSKTA